MPAKKQPPAKPKTTPAAAKKKKDAADRNLTLEQLSGKVRELRSDLIRQLNQIRAGASGNVRRPGQIRRQIARHLTVAGERRRQKADAKTAEPPAQTDPDGSNSPKAKPAASAKRQAPKAKKQAK